MTEADIAGFTFKESDNGVPPPPEPEPETPINFEQMMGLMMVVMMMSIVMSIMD